MNLAVLATHPIQYQVPFFKALAEHPDINLEVFYCHRATPKEQAQAGFGIEFNWDRLSLAGFKHSFLENVAQQPSIHTFAGLDNPEFARLIGEHRFDAVMTNGWNYRSAWQAIRKCWKTQTPVMVRSDSHLQTNRSLSRRTMKWPFYRWFIPRLDACLPVGTWSKQYFQHYGAIEKNMVVVPHCIDDQHFSEQAQQLRPVRTELRQAFELGADQTVFLFVGKFIGIKRPMFFAEAVRRAARANSNIVGLMVGDGPLRTELEEFIAEKEVPIRLTGFLNQGEIARAYIAADALVVPSEEETWGLVVNEAMTCGLPCIVGDTVGCSPDLIRSGETGEIFSSDDLDSLVNLMKSWADQSEKLTTMGVAAKRLIASYSTEQAVQAMVEAVRTVQGEN